MVKSDLQKNFESLIQNTPESIFIQVNGKFEFINQACLKLIGADSAEEILGQKIINRVDKKYHEDVIHRIKQLNADKKPVPIMEQVYLRMDNSKIFVEVSATPIVYKGKNGALAFVRNITQLKRSEQQYRDLFTKMNEAFIVCEIIYDGNLIPIDLKIIYANKVTGDVLMKPIENIQGILISKLYPYFHKYSEVFRKSIIQIINGSSLKYEVYFQYIDRILIVNAYNCGIDQIALILDDVTETRRQQEKLMEITNEQEKLIEQRTAELTSANIRLRSVNEYLTEFSYAVKHDLNNILINIEKFSQLINQELKQNSISMIIKYIRVIYKESKKGLTYIKELDRLYSSTSKELLLTKVDLSKMSLSIINKLKKKYPEREILFEYENKINVVCDEKLLHLLLLNLFSNAIKFSRDQINISIYFKKEMINEVEFISVKDNGIGFDMTLKDNIFLPFYRVKTKNRIAGNGIGLSIVKRIIQLHNGEIFTKSIPNEGTTFYFKINP